MINNTFQLRAAIESKIPSALSNTASRIYLIIDRFVKEYYAEFSPEIYERTYQLYKSLVKTDVMKTASGYRVELYFDASSLDYAFKTVNGNKVANVGYDEKKTLSSAMYGSHGGYENGTAIWDESMAIVHSQLSRILREELVKNGIPLK